MRLADAIEAWGQEHRSELELVEVERLGQIWSVIKRSDAAELEFDTMSKDDARSIMALFPQDERKEVSATLNSVRSWSLRQKKAHSEPDADRADTPAVAMPPTSVPPTAVPPSTAAAVPEPPIATIEPRGHQPAGTAPPHGPVEPLVPAGTTGDSGTKNSTKFILIALGAAVVALIAYFGFRDSDNDGSNLATTGGAGIGFANEDDGNNDNGDPGDTGDNVGNSVGANVFSGGGDFCDTARRFEEDDPFDGFGATIGEAYFAETLQIFAQMRAIAPNEIAGDIAVLEAEFTKFRDISARFGFNTADPAMATALLELDTAALEQSSLNIERYLAEKCGIGTVDEAGSDPAATFGDPTELQAGIEGLSDDEAEALGTSVLAALGVTPELAECLERELGNIEDATADPSLLTKEVCGTTLLNVITGAGGG